MREWLRDKYPIPKEYPAWVAHYTRRTSQEGEVDEFEEKFQSEKDAKKFLASIGAFDVKLFLQEEKTLSDFCEDDEFKEKFVEFVNNIGANGNSVQKSVLIDAINGKRILKIEDFNP